MSKKLIYPILIVSVLLLTGNTYALTVNVKTDLSGLGCPYGNAAGDGTADDANAINWAISYVIGQGGGDVYLPSSTYAVKNIQVFEDANLIGDGPGSTIVRPHPNDHSGGLIYLKGGCQVRDLTAYGTLPADSGSNWTCGDGESTHIINARAADDADPNKISLMKNVYVYEAKYDPLCIRDINNLYVVDCKFDRAGRNTCSHIGNTVNDVNEGFFFYNCDFGSLRGLYHWDIEPTDGRAINGGIFLNCNFNGYCGGAYGTNNNCWGCFLGLKGTDSSPYYRKNVATLGCDFNDVYIFLNKVFDNAQFIDNTMDSPSGYDIFRKYEDAGVGELKDARIVGNEFVGASSWGDVIDQATFSGNSFFACNTSLKLNDSGYSWPVPGSSDLALLHSVKNLEDLPFEDLMTLVNNCPRELIDYDPLVAWGPSPADRATSVSTTADLSWTPGYDANSHDVYFGTASSPPYIGNQDSNTYDPGTMSASTIYYWRIDEVDESNVVTTGDVWSLSTGSDSTNPTPSPMTWTYVPYQTGSSTIDMVCSEASDWSGVEYYFENQTIGGHNSGWQDCRFWQDTGLSSNTQYCYKVKARDKSNSNNETSWSSQECATTSCGTAPMYRNGITANVSTVNSFSNAILPLLPSLLALGMWGIYRKRKA